MRIRIFAGAALPALFLAAHAFATPYAGPGFRGGPPERPTPGSRYIGNGMYAPQAPAPKAAPTRFGGHVTTTIKRAW